MAKGGAVTFSAGCTTVSRSLLVVRQCWLVAYSFFSSIFRVIYGLELRQEGDPFLSLAEETMEGEIIVTVPGAFQLTWSPFVSSNYQMSAHNPFQYTSKVCPCLVSESEFQEDCELLSHSLWIAYEVIRNWREVGWNWRHDETDQRRYQCGISRYVMHSWTAQFFLIPMKNSLGGLNTVLLFYLSTSRFTNISHADRLHWRYSFCVCFSSLRSRIRHT